MDKDPAPMPSVGKAECTPLCSQGPPGGEPQLTWGVSWSQLPNKLLALNVSVSGTQLRQ